MSNSYESLERMGNGYSWKVAFTYVFNLIFGGGALALPKAFAQTGIILGLITLCILVLMSYCAATFIIEVLAITNAMIRYTALNKDDKCSGNIENGVVLNGGPKHKLSKENDERAPLINDATLDHTKQNRYNGVVVTRTPKDLANDALKDDELFEITNKVETGEMATIFFNKAGVVLMYSIISVYLYGALAIYSCGIAKCITTIICEDTDIFKGDVHLTCKRMKVLNVIGIYRCMLGVVALALGPFVFFNMSKTRFLQVFTTLFRWLSFTAMVVLSVIKITENNRHAPLKLFDVSGLSNFFGIGLASLMCQNALPSILTSMNEKKKLKLVVLLDFLAVLLCNVCILLTAIFAFGEDIQDLYTLNFSHPPFFKYALQLFPVFTLSANFPTVGLTLCENLKTLFLRTNEDGKRRGFVIRRLLFPLLTVVPPFVISYNTYDVGMLISITGAYPGAILQYLFPALFVYFARKRVKDLFGRRENKYQSAFAHTFWIIFMLVWYVISFIFVTVNFIL